MLWILLTAVPAFALGTFLGMRLQLAKGRWRELRRGIAMMQASESIESAFAATLSQRTAFETGGLVHHVKVVNGIQFVLTWNWDLRVLLDLMEAAPEAWNLETGWRRTLFARTLVLTTYETLVKLDGMFDPTNTRKSSLRRALRTIGVEPSVEASLDKLHVQVCAVLDKHRQLLEGIRNNVIGHRDLDVATQLLWMRKTNPDEIKALGYELLGLTTSAVTVLTETFAAVRSRPPLRRGNTAGT